MATYQEKLKDPRWQKKRLVILSRDNFTCLFCGSTDKTLHIHHIEYEKGKEPWEYNNDWLKTLCCDCHETETIHRDSFDYKIKRVLRKSNLSCMEVANLVILCVDKCALVKDFIKLNAEPDGTNQNS
jgi:5-methylcytosine-specific restriction endonuclease McrA